MGSAREGLGKSTRAGTLLPILLLVAGNLGAQTSAEQPTLRIKTSVRLVEVDVIAKDKVGHPVKGLTAKDFTLLDNGHVQQIRRFSIEQDESGTKAGTPPPIAGDPSDRGVTFSNIHPETSAATVILFDRLNTPAEDQSWMKTQLLRSLNQLKANTPIALLFLGDDLTVVGDFTTNSISLANAMGQSPSMRMEGFGPPIMARATGNPIRDKQILRATTQTLRADERERVVRTLAALNIIAEQLGRVRGRKSLLWLTAGLSVPGESGAVQNAIDNLNNANISVYTLDARGVVMDYDNAADTDTNDLAAPMQEEREENRGDVIEVIARSTGGVFYHNTNRLDVAISHAIEDKSLVYTLAYYPQHSDWTGKFHKIEVKALRPGIRLRYRTGYLATPPPKTNDQDQQQMLAAVAASPLDFPGIRFSVEVKAGQSHGGPSFVLHIPADELQLSGQNKTMIGALQVWFIQRRSSGEDLVTSTAKSDLNLAADAYQAALRQGVAVMSDLKLHDDAAKIRVLLRDLNSGRIGTVDVPVDALPAPQTR